MNRKTVKCIAASLAVLSCMYTIPQRVMAATPNTGDEASYTINKDKCDDKKEDKKKDKCDDKKKEDKKKDKCDDVKKEDKKKDKCDDKQEDKKKDEHKDHGKCKDEKPKKDIFTEENCKYLSSDQKKQLDECKKCTEKGDKLTEAQQKALHEMVDCIIKGKLGDTKYKDFISLMEKKNKGTKLTEDEEKKLKEYMNTIEGKDKPTSAEIIKQFLR